MTLRFYPNENLIKLTSKRDGEQKVGEILQACTDNWEQEIAESKAKIVLLGISEDIGVQANLGRPGTESAFEAFLETFVNVQVNHTLPVNNVLLLGNLVPTDIISRSKGLSPSNRMDLEKLRALVHQVDSRVRGYIQAIVASGKIPLIIGGGHNNAYPIISGSSLAKEQSIQVINCDPHSDFRTLEGRHSGNGFSYAMEDGFLERYSIVGLHESYNSESVLETMTSNQQIHYQMFEDTFIRLQKSWATQIEDGIAFLNQKMPVGIELDMDAIAGMPVSAATPSGLRLEEARQYIHKGASLSNLAYVHLCEAAPTLHPEGKAITGKALSYLVQDVIKAVCSK